MWNQSFKLVILIIYLELLEAPIDENRVKDVFKEEDGA